jgi:hypothetical protein
VKTGEDLVQQSKMIFELDKDTAIWCVRYKVPAS